MKPSNEQLVNTWLDSIIEREIQHVINVAEGEHDEGYFQEEAYELWWKADMSHDYDHGDYWTPPYSELRSIDIEFTLQIYNAKGDISIERFYSKQITL